MNRAGPRGRRLVSTLVAIVCSLGVFVPSAAAAPPTIVKTIVSNVTADSATLRAEINPGGKPTIYHFEYGLQDCATNPCTSVPAPDASIAAGSSPVLVPPVQITGLTPHTTYHLRVVAKNTDALAGVAGPDRPFTTHGPAFAGLPDGRVYEQASPVDKNAADARGTIGWVKAADDGEAVSFLSTSGIPGGEGGQEIPTYLASRGASDWSTQGVLPSATSGNQVGNQASIRGWLPNLSVFFDFTANIGELAAGQDGAFLARSSGDGSLTPIAAKGDGLTRIPGYAGASADGSKVLFEARAKLSCCPQALEGKANVYLWDRDSGQTSLVSVLNDEKPPTTGDASAGPYNWMLTQNPLSASAGGAIGSYYTQDTHAISAAGDIAYYTAGGDGKLYARINPSEAQSDLDGEEHCTEPALACTLEVSATDRTPPDPLGSRPAAFMAATPGGDTAFFTSPEELTDNANTHEEAGPPPPHLIGTATLEGTGRDEDLIPASASALDVDATHIYWADPIKNAIGRALLDGTAVEPEFISGAENPQGVVIEGSTVYWTNAASGSAGAGSIGRAMLDGGGDLIPASVEQDFIAGASDPRGIDVDGTYVYWANHGSTNPSTAASIGRSNLAGTVVSQFFIELESRPPVGLAVDATHIYLTRTNEAGAAYLYRFPIDGGDGKENHESAVGVGVDPGEVAVDGLYIYWTDKAQDHLGRLDIDNYGPIGVEFFVAGIDSPEGLAVDNEHLYWSSRPAQAVAAGNDLYRYRVADRSLLDLTPEASAANGAEVKGVLGASEDGKRVYFAANGDLDGAGEATAGNCQGTFSVFVSFSGQCSLYLAEETADDVWSTSFIARLDASGDDRVSDAVNWLGKNDGLGHLQKSARTSADGSVLLFGSQAQLTPFDNEGEVELYRYEVGEGLACVSCNPSDETPSGPVRLGSIGVSFLEPERGAAATLNRNLSADGNRVFFETTDPLVAGDVNGLDGCPEEGSSQFHLPACLDVYEWEAQGSGSCEEDVQGGGCLYLLSTGTSPHTSYFADASASGDDAFIATRSAGLVRRDQDQLQDIYDVRVGGGLPKQNEEPELPCEGLDGCRRPATPAPGFQSPGSASFSGPSNKKPHRVAKKRHGKKHRHKKHRQKSKRVIHASVRSGL